MAANEPIIARGKRATIAGRTGSGKSTLGKWLLQRSPGTWIILNPKHTAAYLTLPNSVVLKGLDVAKLDKLMREYKFIDVWPSEHECNDDAMDDFIAYLIRTYSNFGVCVDELYSLHGRNGQAGPGLMGLLTRGRELKQSYIGMTQRPAFISKFCFSEADYVAGMTLLSEDDRKMMTKNTGRNEFAKEMAPHDWLWFDAANAKMRFFGPVPIN